MADRLEEAFRLVFETSGQQGVDALRAALERLGVEGTDAGNDVAEAIDRITRNSEDLERVNAFVKLKKQLVETEAQLEKAQAGAQELFRTFSADDTSSSRIRKLQDEARKSVNSLSDAAIRQREQLQRVRRELEASGLSTRNLGTAQGELRRRMDEAQGNLRRTVTNLQQYRKESQQAAKDIPATNERIAQSYGKIGGALNRLRSLAAPVLAFLSFEGARRGIANLAQVAQKAEDARRSLGEMYKDVQLGNRVYAELERLALRNGLALDATVAAAQKLKNFGLDPLAGSLQALIDQNAAVGGSQQDLEGKILALGQAWAKQKLQGEEILQLVERGVPVWDLLQKATGKNVQELQKLSGQGKLGRDVIAQLYQTIGSENAGAAQRSLGALSGLIAQASAKWLEFRQKIVDAGVGEYLKQQLQSILDSTGGIDRLAKRVSDGIVNVLDTLRLMGKALLPVGRAVAELTSLLANNAKTVALVALAWGTLRLARLAAGMGGLATSVRATTAALIAQHAALAATTGSGITAYFAMMAKSVAGAALQVKALGTLMLRVSRVAGWPAAAVTAATLLGKVYEEQVQILARREASEARLRQLERDGIQLGRQLQVLYAQYAGTVIQSNEEIKNLSLEQAEAYQFNLESARRYYEGIVKEAVHAGRNVDPEIVAALRRIDGALAQTKARIVDLGDTAASQAKLTAFADAAVAKFDELRWKGEETKKAISGIFDGIDWTGAKGASQAVQILTQIQGRGREAADAVEGELIATLAKLSAETLPEVERRAVQAFGAGSEEAKKMAAAIDKASLAKLGVDLDAIRTGFTDTGREAVNAFRLVVDEIDSMGLTAEQRAVAIAAAFDNAFKQASTKAELEALKQALKDALASGDIGFQEFQQRIAQTDAALEALKGTGASIGQAIEEGAARGGQALGGLSDAAASAAADLDKQGDAAVTAGEKSKEGAKGTEEFRFSLRQMSDAAIQALTDLNRFAGSPLWNDLWNEQMAQIDGQYAALQGISAELDAQLAKMDPLADKLQQLRQQYQMVDEATLRGLAEKQKRVEEQIERRREEARRERQRIIDEAQAEADRASAGTGRTVGAAVSNRPARSLGTLRVELPTGDNYDIPTTDEGAHSLQAMLDALARAQSTSQLRRRR